MRAVEEGLPMVRAANTGISAVIDSYGRTVARLGLGRRDTLDAPLPAAAAPTAYARWGDWMLLVLLFILSVAGALSHRSARDRRQAPSRAEPSNGA